MSFFYKPYDLNKNNKRSLRTQCKAQAKCRIYVEKSLCRKRAFCCISFPGAMTVEAAFIVPLFIFAIVCLLSLFYMLGTCCQIYYAMAQTAHHASIYGYDEDCSTSVVAAMMAGKLMSKDIPFVFDGVTGVNIYGTSYDKESGEITLAARYKLKPLIDTFGIGMDAKTVVKTRAYIGGKMLTEESAVLDENYTTVYVAENGVVYHRNRQCAYIDITLSASSTADIASQRNSQGGKYYSCELCSGNGNGGIVYITGTGNRYHSDVECSGIRRTVYEMKIDKNCPLPSCSRCGD